MRLLILSDIHSNLEALDACLGAAEACDRFVNLGDTVGYGADPNSVIGRVRPHGGLTVRGNHDHAVLDAKEIETFNPIAAEAVQWTRNQLTPENLAWLREVPPGPVYEPGLAGVQFVHGSPAGEDDYILSEFSARAAFAASSAQVIFFGHTHIQSAVKHWKERNPGHSSQLCPASAGGLNAAIFRWKMRRDISSTRARWASRATATGAPALPFTTRRSTRFLFGACRTMLS